ncbi:MAG: hypothetical protein K8W52_07020 [Deltaproteobacteria bacterium]|nr:hypothetical protein [Deltaproteobacteria bacterium]
MPTVAPARLARLAALLLFAACSSESAPGTADAPAAAPDSPAAEDLDATAADFECVLHWDQVGPYRVTNKLGHDAKSVALSPTGGTFPVGTILQIVPTEAMVKRRVGFDAASNDWEFFALDVSASGTTITTRGTTNVVNRFGGNCLSCHAKAMPQFDLVCGTTHGCDALPVSEQTLVDLQNSDPRCP